jgi:hypothetical protein
MKSTKGDIHQVKKWLGHKNASLTLDVYGHCIDDPESRAKFERMPDWLVPVQETGSLPTPRPVEITEPLRALPAPEDSAAEDSFEFGPKVNGSVEPDCPIDVPHFAEPWVKPFIRLLYQGMPLMEAYREIGPLMIRRRGQQERECRVDQQEDALGFGHVKNLVRKEFERLKLPLPKTVVIRFREEKILKLHGQKYQDLEIARSVGRSYDTVHNVLKSRHKGNANNPLNYKINNGPDKMRRPQAQHKTQLKLL